MQPSPTRAGIAVRTPKRKETGARGAAGIGIGLTPTALRGTRGEFNAEHRMAAARAGIGQKFAFIYLTNVQK
jgi:hypothetical protein